MCYRLFHCLVFTGISILLGSMTYSQYNWEHIPEPTPLGQLRSITSNSANELFTTSLYGAYRQSFEGSEWVTITDSTFEGPYITSLGLNHSNDVFAGTYHGQLLKSTNSGNTWLEVFNGGFQIGPIAVNNNGDLYMGDFRKIYKSTDNGTTWIQLTSLPNFYWIKSIKFNSSGHVFLGLSSEGVFRSTDNGATWSTINSGLLELAIQDLVVDTNNKIYVATENSVFYSINNGDSWIQTNSPGPGLGIRKLLIGYSNEIFCGTWNGGVFVSQDGGNSWLEKNNGLTESQIQDIHKSNFNRYYCVTEKNGIFYSTNSGESWLQLSGALTAFMVQGLDIDRTSNTRIFSEFYSVYKTNSYLGTWEKIFESVKSIPTSHIISPFNILVSVFQDGLYKTTDSGGNWTKLQNGLTINDIYALESINQRIFAGGSKGALFLSTDNGNSWVQKVPPWYSGDVRFHACLIAKDPAIVLFCSSNKLYKSTDNGDSWTAIPNTINFKQFKFSPYSGDIWATSGSQGIFKSTDNGDTWQNITNLPTSKAVSAIEISESNIIYLGTAGNGIFMSSDNGLNWTTINSGLTNPFISNISVDSYENIVCGTIGYGMYKCIINPVVNLLSLTYHQLDHTEFPIIKSYVSVTDYSGISINNLNETNFEVRENNTDQSPISVSQISGGFENISVALVLDRSGSMIGQPIDDAKTAAITFVNQLSVDDKGAIISFNELVTIDQSFTNNKTLLINAINNMSASGATAIFDALHQSINLISSQTERKAIILLTDGEDNSSTHSIQDVIYFAIQENVPVFTIGLDILQGSNAELNLLQISQQTGGKYYRAPSSSDLTQIYLLIAQQINNQYLITYTSNNTTCSGWTREVDITVNFNGLTDSKIKFYSAFPWVYTSNTGSNATIAIPLSSNPQLCDGSLQSGDVIGVFFTRNDSLICAGYTVWTGTQNISITAWGDDAQTAIKDGFAEGELIKFKIWDSVNCTEYMADVTYSTGNGNYTTNGILVVSSLNAICTVTQTIALNSGWNMISSYIEPVHPHLDSVMQNIWNAMELMKNGAGQVYWPLFGINNIVNWNVKDGYQIYMNSPENLSITGTKADNQITPLPLVQGWNMISYILDCPVNIEIALASINSFLVIAKNGNGDVYWPEFSINNIGNMQPGQGYQIYVSSACTLTYPNCPPLVAKSIRGGEEEVEVQSAVVKKQTLSHYTNALKNTGGNATMVVSSAVFEQGDEVGVFSSSGILVGSGLVESGRAVITIWSDNAMTEETDGAKDGEELYLNLWKKNNKEEIKLNITQLTEVLSGNLQMNKLEYQTDGLYIAEAEEEVQIPTSCMLEQNYPNPFNPSTVIRYGIPTDGRVRLEIYDVIGQVVEVLVEEEQKAGYYEISYTNLKLSSGVYFYRLQTGDFVQTKKMLLIK